MSNKEILEKAIQKAIDGGWKPDFPWPLPLFWDVDSDGIWRPTDYDSDHLHVTLETLIFNHDFAKALWGEGFDEATWKVKWRYHLQQMVTSDDPIKYLGENI